MAWKECKPMDERLRFIARLLEGEKMAPLCREFGISRVTGYKIWGRYGECGLDALYDRSRRPYRHANRLPFQVERSILGIKREHPSWGAPKIRDKLIRQFPILKRVSTSAKGGAQLFAQTILLLRPKGAGGAFSLGVRIEEFPFAVRGLGIGDRAIAQAFVEIVETCADGIRLALRCLHESLEVRQCAGGFTLGRMGLEKFRRSSLAFHRRSLHGPRGSTRGGPVR